jgi:hypothetical protein
LNVSNLKYIFYLLLIFVNPRFETSTIFIDFAIWLSSVLEIYRKSSGSIFYPFLMNTFNTLNLGLVKSRFSYLLIQKSFFQFFLLRIERLIVLNIVKSVSKRNRCFFEISLLNNLLVKFLLCLLLFLN